MVDILGISGNIPGLTNLISQYPWDTRMGPLVYLLNLSSYHVVLFSGSLNLIPWNPGNHPKPQVAIYLKPHLAYF